jgi:hypothetical protein
MKTTTNTHILLSNADHLDDFALHLDDLAQPYYRKRRLCEARPPDGYPGWLAKIIARTPNISHGQTGIKQFSHDFDCFPSNPKLSPHTIN